MNTPSNNKSRGAQLFPHLKSGNLFSIKREEFSKEQTSNFDQHYQPELILVDKGTLGCFIEGGFFTAIAGDLVVINPLQTHRLARVNQEPLVVWILDFDDKLLQANGIQIGNWIFDELVRDPKITALFRVIIQEKTQALSWSNEYIQNVIQLILLCLLRDHARASSEKSNVPPLLQAIITHIHANFAQQLTLESIGNAVGISRWYLSKFFKKEMGISIIDYINQYRCSHALILLQKSEYAVSKIAEICGFASLEYFSRIYAKQYGHPPSRERELRNKGDLSNGLYASYLATATEGSHPKSRNKTVVKK